MQDVMIIGAGAAGLMAAQILSAQGLKVAVYEKMKSPARKFLLAGRGGLNLTHGEDLSVFLTRYSKAQGFMTPLITAFTPQNMREWAQDLGIETFVGSSGRVFPQCFKASPLLRAWLRRLEAQGVRFHFDHQWLGFEGQTHYFNHGRSDETRLVLLAMGGASWAKMGSDGAYAPLLAKKGVEMTPFKPSNMGFKVNWSAYMAPHFGEPLKNMRFTFQNQSLISEAVITQEGIEGSAIYALSHFLRDEIDANGFAELTLDFKPHLSMAQTQQQLLKNAQGSSATKLKKLKLSPAQIALIHEQKGDLLGRIKHLTLKLSGYQSMDKAISTAGGVALNALNQDLSLKAFPHIFIAGEMIDFEAPTGGYLLQGAFSSGVAAAHGIFKALSLSPWQKSNFALDKTREIGF